MIRRKAKNAYQWKGIDKILASIDEQIVPSFFHNFFIENIRKFAIK